jgi:hypothetical protein
MTQEEVDSVVSRTASVAARRKIRVVQDLGSFRFDCASP